MEQDAKIDGKDPGPDPMRRGSNQSGMRAYNERLVLTMIRQSGSMAKAEIARQTGLSAQTVSVIIRALEADGLLTRGKPVRGKIGQPSIPMRLAEDGAYFFGLKVGRRSLDLVLTDFLGNVLYRVRTNHAYPTPDNTLTFASDGIAEIQVKLSAHQKSRIAGLGIALPFQLWEWAETLDVADAAMDGWKDRDIAAELAATWNFPVFVCNDASTACGAELVFGDQNRPQDFLYLYIGFFVGGGLVLDNTLYTGRTGNGAAFGSMMVQAADGSMHQLVDLASLATLEDALVTRDQQNAMIWDMPDSWDVPEATLKVWVTSAAPAIAQAVMSSVCLIDVSHVLIDGWMPEKMRAMLVCQVRHEIASMSAAGVQKPEVVEGSIGRDARALGAASLPLSNRFLVDRNTYQNGAGK